MTKTKLIDADKLLEWLKIREGEAYMNADQVFNPSFLLGKADAFNDVVEHVKSGCSDLTPSPTIKLGDIIADLLFAFINQDADCPHEFEIQAVEQAVEYLKHNYQSDKYNPYLFESHLKQMLEVSHD